MNEEFNNLPIVINSYSAEQTIPEAIQRSFVQLFGDNPLNPQRLYPERLLRVGALLSYETEVPFSVSRSYYRIPDVDVTTLPPDQLHTPWNNARAAEAKFDNFNYTKRDGILSPAGVSITSFRGPSSNMTRDNVCSLQLDFHPSYGAKPLVTTHEAVKAYISLPGRVDLQIIYTDGRLSDLTANLIPYSHRIYSTEERRSRSIPPLPLPPSAHFQTGPYPSAEGAFIKLEDLIKERAVCLTNNYKRSSPYEPKDQPEVTAKFVYNPSEDIITLGIEEDRSIAKDLIQFKMDLSKTQLLKQLFPLPQFSDPFEAKPEDDKTWTSINLELLGIKCLGLRETI